LSKPKCTRNPGGRIIRWENEEILEEMKKRIEGNKDKIKERSGGTSIWNDKKIFGGYMLMKGIKRVGAEMSLTILAYNRG
jgi:hypothetical protein